MKRALKATLLLVAVLFALPSVVPADIKRNKDHDFIPKVHNLVFVMDISDSMMSGYPQTFDLTRHFVSWRAFKLFNHVMPHVPRWQYDLNTAVITFGDKKCPKIVSPLSPWERVKYDKLFPCLREDGFYPCRTAGFQEALQLAGSILGTACGRGAVLVLSDGGSIGECPQKTATALKDQFGDKIRVYGIYFGNTESGWRNLYEACKLTGGYARHWEDVRTHQLMQDFAYDMTVQEIMFPYPEIFFKHESADLIPPEAIKLESVANFLHAIPQYVLQIDGHSDFLGGERHNFTLAMKRARTVRDALVRMYNIHPDRIRIRSWGEELPRYDNQNLETRARNNQANLYLVLPLRNFPYDEKNLHTFGVKAVGDLFNTQERNNDREWAWPDTPPPGAAVPVKKRIR
jgi:OOP family OmpA-OmpF porin